MIGYLPLIWKDSITDMDVLAVYVKEELPFAWDLSPENCWFLLMFFIGFTTRSIFLLFPLSITCFVFRYGFIDDVLSVNLSANANVFGDF